MTEHETIMQLCADLYHKHEVWVHSMLMRHAEECGNRPPGFLFTELRDERRIPWPPAPEASDPLEGVRRFQCTLCGVLLTFDEPWKNRGDRDG